MRRVLVVDDEETLRHTLQLFLRQQGYEAVGAASVEAALQELEALPYDVVLAGLPAAARPGADLLTELQRRKLDPTVVVLAAPGAREAAVEAMKRGAYDHLPKPFVPDEVLLMLRKAEERDGLRRELERLRRQVRGADGAPGELDEMVGASPLMVDLFRTLRKIAEYKTTVLVGGESGTGKELVARALHKLSPRREAPFIAVNCGAIPAPLLESELFGHRKGAFTDALRDRKGLFEEASGGTLFLDEIGELPLALQVKLLRVLQEEELRRLGDTQDIRVDVRVVAATARDLQAEVARGAFREDLYYRLNVVSLRLPALRERREDIPLLIAHFMRRMNARLGLSIGGVTDAALRLLVAHDWPGNVRELENTIERAMVLTEGEAIDVDSLPDRLREAPAVAAGPAAGAEGEDLSIKRASRRAEEELIRRALARTGGNRTRAAELLEISHRALLYKIKEYGIAPGRGADASANIQQGSTRRPG
jgi:two-component system response regulator AtoC